MPPPETDWKSQWGRGRIGTREKSNAARKIQYAIDDLGSGKGLCLEIGCGRGKFIASIQDDLASFSFLGCDIDVPGLAEARRFAPMKSRVGYCAGDMMFLPFRDHSFDALMYFDVLEHLRDPRAAVKESFRVLKPGGKVHAFIPCEANPWTLHGCFYRWKVLPWLKSKMAGHVQHFRNDEVLGLFRDDGFKVLRVRYSGYFFEQLFDLLFFLALKIPGLRGALCRAHHDSGMAPESGRRQESKSWVHDVLTRIKRLFFAIGYYETRFFQSSPYCLGIHVTAVRE